MLESNPKTYRNPCKTRHSEFSVGKRRISTCCFTMRFFATLKMMNDEKVGFTGVSYRPNISDTQCISSSLNPVLPNFAATAHSPDSWCVVAYSCHSFRFCFCWVGGCLVGSFWSVIILILSGCLNSCYSTSAISFCV